MWKYCRVEVELETLEEKAGVERLRDGDEPVEGAHEDLEEQHQGITIQGIKMWAWDHRK